MALMRIHTNLLLDPSSLMFVRFENLETDPIAFLKFTDGTSETVAGEAAVHLHNHLNRQIEPNANLEPPKENPESEAKHSGSDTFEGLDLVPDPYIGRNKSWFYARDERGKQHFFAFVNAKGSCSMRTFDAETGIFLGKQYRSGNYQDQFSKVIGNAIELTVNSQPNLERDCKQRLPESVLSHLRRELSDLKES